MPFGNTETLFQRQSLCLICFPRWDICAHHRRPMSAMIRTAISASDLLFLKVRSYTATRLIQLTGFTMLRCLVTCQLPIVRHSTPCSIAWTATVCEPFFVESADRFARKMLTAEVGILALIERGVTLYTATGENLTNTDDEMKVAFRQIAMAFAQLEKTRLVKKLAGSRDRKSAVAGFRIEGRAGHVRGDLPLVRLTKALRNQGKTLAEIGAALAEQGHRTKAGGIFQPAQVKRLVEGIPFGYDKIAIDPSAKKLTYKLAPDDVEQAAIASARTLHSSGADITAVRAHIASLGYHLTMGDVRKLLSP
jgi:hypothetical protein